MMNSLWEELKNRGLVYSATPHLEEHIKTHRVFYYGIDPTSGTLHVGHLLGLLTLKRIRSYGHTAIVLIGGATGLIGDPSGKDSERPLMDKKAIKANIATCLQQAKLVLGKENTNTHFVNNAEWIEKVKLTDFLREVGKYITVNTMLDKDSVSSRISRNEGISYAEFSYQLLQAYDFLHLFEQHGCSVEIGGSDQWGNMIQGIELIRKKLAGEAHVLAYPLIVDPKTGKKFGKTEKGNAIALDPAVTHPYHLYQFFLNLPDEVAENMLLMYSSQDVLAIKDTIALFKKEPHKRLVHKTLARELVGLIHGQKTVAAIETVNTALFEADFSTIHEEEFAVMRAVLPTIQEKTTVSSVEEYAVKLGLVASKKEAQRLLMQQGLKKHELKDGHILVQKGKKDFGIVLKK